MSLEIQLLDTSSLIYWSDAMRVLGIKRCHPVLRTLGVPASIAAEPAGLSEAAEYFWRNKFSGIKYRGARVDIGYGDPNFPENYRLGIQALLRETFELLLGHYAERDVFLLLDWTYRFFVDQNQVNLWSIWAALFSGPRVIEVDWFSSAPEKANRVNETIDRHFGKAIQAGDNIEVSAIEQIPLSTFEKRMIALEVTSPTDFPEADLSGILKLVVQYKHAYQTWLELNDYLSVTEHNALLWWAYEHAEDIGIPIEDVRLPI